MTSLIIFGLLILLMLTGMPISIALGLTVLTFIYTMTNVPTESVALKLFTGIDNFEIMAIPFFILAGNFLTHGGVARRMIDFATSMVGHWYGGLGLAGVMACALFAAVSDTWLWFKNLQLARRQTSPLMEAQWRFFRSKAICDYCVLASLGCSLVFRAFDWSVYIDTLFSFVMHNAPAAVASRNSAATDRAR